MDFIGILSIFVMACFVGYYVVWSVTPALHTPLMSVTNAISSVIVVGALLAVGVSTVGDAGHSWGARIFGFIALVFASVMTFRTLGGEYTPQAHEGITAAALFWFATVALYLPIWLAIYVTK